MMSCLGIYIFMFTPTNTEMLTYLWKRVYSYKLNRYLLRCMPLLISPLVDSMLVTHYTPLHNLTLVNIINYCRISLICAPASNQGQLGISSMNLHLFGFTIKSENIILFVLLKYSIDTRYSSHTKSWMHSHLTFAILNISVEIWKMAIFVCVCVI